MELLHFIFDRKHDQHDGNPFHNLDKKVPQNRPTRPRSRDRSKLKNTPLADCDSPPPALIATCSNECSNADDYQRKIMIGSEQSTRSEAREEHKRTAINGSCRISPSDPYAITASHLRLLAVPFRRHHKLNAVHEPSQKALRNTLLI
jgi:hypothetical protein